jgi:hypothetical protein
MQNESDFNYIVLTPCKIVELDINWEKSRTWITYIRILPNHLCNFRRNHFTLLTPCCRALEDGDALVHDGFEVLGFGVEGGDFCGHDG